MQPEQKRGREKEESEPSFKNIVRVMFATTCVCGALGYLCTLSGRATTVWPLHRTKLVMPVVFMSGAWVFLAFFLLMVLLWMITGDDE